MKCPHKQLSIQETGTWGTQHNRETDGVWTHNNEPGHYFQKLEVKCFDCGMTGRYSKGSKRLPKWLVIAKEELGMSTTYD